MNDRQKRVLREANTVCDAIHDPQRLGRERDALRDQLDTANAFIRAHNIQPHALEIEQAENAAKSAEYRQRAIELAEAIKSQDKTICDQSNAINAANARIKELESPRKMAPVQGYSAGIPWDMHLRAYDVYCKRYSPQPALIEGWCRGGFGDTELDMFIPGWREELSERSKLQERIAQMEALLRDGLTEMPDSEWKPKVLKAFPDLAGRLAETNSAPTVTSGSPEFDAWWLVLQTMAKERALFFLLSAQGDHKQAWLDGLTPEDELDSQLESAKDSQ